MTEPNAALEPGDDTWLDGLLRGDAREHDAVYLADDGFTAKVVAALPAPVMLPSWRRPVIAALWGVAGVGIVAFLPGAAADALREVVHVVAAHRFTMSEVFTAVLGVSAATWIGGFYALRQE